MRIAKRRERGKNEDEKKFLNKSLSRITFNLAEKRRIKIKPNFNAELGLEAA